MPRKLIDYKFFEKRFDDIARIARETGELKKIAEFLGITVNTLTTQRKKHSDLDKLIQSSIEKYRPYTQEQLEIIIRMDKTHQHKDIAEFLGIPDYNIRHWKKIYPELSSIRNGQFKLINKDTLKPDNLNKIKSIAQKGFRKDVAKYLKVDRQTLRNYCKIYPELELAIQQGLDSGNKREKYLKYSNTLKPDFIEYNLHQIEKTIEKTGQIKSANKILNVCKKTSKKLRGMYPELEAAVQRGLASYKTNKLKLELSGDTEKSIKERPIELFKFKKPKKELIAHIDSVDNDMEDALARYRRIKESEKESMSRRELKNMDIL